MNRTNFGIFSLLVLFNAISSACVAQIPAKAPSANSLADALYAVSGNKLIWFQPGEQMDRKRASIHLLIDSATYYGLNKDHYQLPVIRGNNQEMSQLLQFDKEFTRTLARFLADLFCGSDVINRHIKNDELTHRFAPHSDSVVLSCLERICLDAGSTPILALPEPTDAQYAQLKKELKSQIDSGNTAKITQLRESINIYRWIKHFNFDRYIQVNIPSATLSLVSHDTIELSMKVVVGKPATRTPRFASWCDKVVLYPYWNVPASIARKELLPAFKRSPAKVAAMNMQILNKNGRIVDPNTIQWSALSSSNFPYTIRQCTGCDNALGVIKYNLTDPFSVYMHDTNYKLAFSSDQRYFSHGCIRLEQPLALGNALLGNKLDSNFLKACLKNQEPVSIDLAKPVPVFIIYLTAVATDQGITYYPDVYRLLR